ncbi:alpha/beta hydrolase [Ochrobactrum sp. CM-21-5]|nr:alpha/beta hydrolase [Ochrobactrum sp. CM-21-5]MBC2883977.1 alpha/beta hydrolase [Ochrobactrum sp. CM-21-5]
MTIKLHELETSHGTIALRESAGEGAPLVMIHGNSSSGAIFRNQLEGEIGRTWRVIAPDLPGHGQSADAIDPNRSYSMEGYADAMTEVLEKLGVQDAVIFGWSLGGHIGIEMISRYPGMRGLMITGTPPVAREEVGQGFKSGPDIALAGQEKFSPRDVEAYARSTCGEPFEASLLDIVARTDGRARRIMFEKFAAGTGGNQRDIVADTKLPIAVVNGRDEPFVEIDFVSKVKFGNLWEGQAHIIDNAGHAPFRETPEIFEAHLARFIRVCTPA